MLLKYSNLDVIRHLADRRLIVSEVVIRSYGKKNSTASGNGKTVGEEVINADLA